MFCQRSSRLQGHSAAGMIGSIKNPIVPHRESNPRPSGFQCSAFLNYATANHDFICHTHEETRFFKETINAKKIFKKFVIFIESLFRVHNAGNFTLLQRLQKAVHHICLSLSFQKNSTQPMYYVLKIYCLTVFF